MYSDKFSLSHSQWFSFYSGYFPLARSWWHARKMEITCLRHSLYTAIGWDKEWGDPDFFHSSFLPDSFSSFQFSPFNPCATRTACMPAELWKKWQCGWIACSHTLNPASCGLLPFIAQSTFGTESPPFATRKYFMPSNNPRLTVSREIFDALATVKTSCNDEFSVEFDVM